MMDNRRPPMMERRKSGMITLERRKSGLIDSKRRGSRIFQAITTRSSKTHLAFKNAFKNLDLGFDFDDELLDYDSDDDANDGLKRSHNSNSNLRQNNSSGQRIHNNNAFDCSHQSLQFLDNSHNSRGRSGNSNDISFKSFHTSSNGNRIDTSYTQPLTGSGHTNTSSFDCSHKSLQFLDGSNQGVIDNSNRSIPFDTSRKSLGYESHAPSKKNCSSPSHKHNHNHKNKHKRNRNRVDSHDHGNQFNSNNGNGNRSSSTRLDLEMNDDCDDTKCSECENEIMKRKTKRHMHIAQREERNVRTIRTFTLLFLFAMEVSACVWVYRVAREYDELDFLSRYESHVDTIHKDVVWEIKFNMALMKQLGTTVTSEVIATQQNPPFMTLPRFEIMGGFTAGLGGIEMASFIPLVRNRQKMDWEQYALNHQSWLQDSAAIKATHSEYQRPINVDDIDWSSPLTFHPQHYEGDTFSYMENIGIAPIPPTIWKWEGENRTPLIESLRDDELMAPLWQTSPADANTVNVDLLSHPQFSELYDLMIAQNYQTVMSSGNPIDNLFDWMIAPDQQFRKSEPHACLLEPLFANFTSKEEALKNNEPPMGLVLGVTSYRHLFENILPAAVIEEDNDGNDITGEPDSVYVVLTGSSVCGTNMTYFLEGPDASFVGYHDGQLGLVKHEMSFPIRIYDTITDNVCVQDLHVYPTDAFRKKFNTDKAWIYTFVVVFAFTATSVCFLIYERLVTKREKTKNAALEVVASLFPTGVQDRVLQGVQEGNHGVGQTGNVIASFFPATTVIFADISGFTAWSSTREPEQVFRLLETVYGAMDEIAMKRGVFKVETVGDCYVAVCGLPEAREDHAVAMTRFARDCQIKMASLSQQLEVALGPDTADLAFRIGMHSGPVTGGVLRGQNARFQLFGDTMNMASRMESTGVRERTQMSTTTAQLLIDAGKSKWIEKRSEPVNVKGKGLQQTYFLRDFTNGTVSSKGSLGVSLDTNSAHTFADGEEPPFQSRPSMDMEITVAEKELLRTLPTKTQRLVTWNTEVLLRRIKSIVHKREYECTLDHNREIQLVEVDLSPKVVNQLKRHVQHIASMYRDNPFHNYEHASHVTLSMEKMLSNVRCPDQSQSHALDATASGEFSLNNTKYTNDLWNDPLAQFAVVYSALIHDVDHTGASNNQLIEENDWVAVEYNGKSPAENHSINLAWNTLMLPDYSDVVECLCPTTAELERLKQLVTDAVLATDIFDEDAKKNRNVRWEQVFAGPIQDPENVNNLRVMVVLDHLIQASDVAHTMQHWHVYIKWNERLFHEMSDAYQQGRLAKDPAEFWYEGELSFFDKYVIPLAKKIRECDVFGVSCYEFLNYAETNRTEWETKGKSIVKDYVERYHPTPEINVTDGAGKTRIKRGRARRTSMGHCSSHDPCSTTRAPVARTKSLSAVPRKPKKRSPTNRAA